MSTEPTIQRLDCGCIITQSRWHTHTKWCPEHFVLSFQELKKLGRERAVELLKHTTNGDLI